MATHVSYVILVHLIHSYGILSHLLEDSGAQYVSKFPATLSGFLRLKRLKKAYHPETNAKVESYNKSEITRLGNYVSEHHGN